ncbi:hypothetical protein C0Q70_17147 [Pomacea canaliculata]|uniref:SRCR domain-containing protein n=2 Tax=Pomacea canaliculata TaxID=400727 RepID=A0A2T7NRV6_POMCA|nr:uncharacterized protein LOC112573282 isoform X1 [Pomacea canaliculata]PVD23873.1 hypothetical protein C0Q70_17147 [Pomacea canaliculata]
MRVREETLLLLWVTVCRVQLQNTQFQNGEQPDAIEIVYKHNWYSVCSTHYLNVINEHWTNHMTEVCHHIKASCQLFFQTTCVKNGGVKLIVRRLDSPDIEEVYHVINETTVKDIDGFTIMSFKTSTITEVTTTATPPVPAVSMTMIGTIIGCALGLVAVTLLGFIALKLLRTFNLNALSTPGTTVPENLPLSTYRRRERYTPMPGEPPRGRPPTLPASRPPTKKQELNDEDSVYDSIDPESKATNEDDGYMQPVQVDLSLSCSFTKHEKIDKKIIDDMEDGYLKPSLFSDPPLKRAPEPPGAVGRVRDDAVGTVAVKRPAQKDGDEDDAWEEDYISTIAYVNINLTARTSRVPPVDSKRLPCKNRGGGRGP